MRAAYLSLDRPDIQYTCKELAKGMNKPPERHKMYLKRLARYLQAKPRVVQLISNQEAIYNMSTWVDANHAGCVRTRKSTSGGVVMLGQSTTKTYSKSQAVIALSGGEAEYYGLVSGISHSLGEQVTARDWRVLLDIQLYMDATAGMAIGSRKGLGRVKHIDTVFLWAQEMVRSGRVTIKKKHTTEMLADMLTKIVPGPRADALMRNMGFRVQAGRHEKGLRA